MQMTPEARAWLDATVRRILARHPLGDPERAGVTYELMSHLHAAGEARATAAGRAEVEREDLEAALVEAGGELALAAAFVQPLSRPIERVLFWRRVFAFGVDAIILGVALSFVHGLLEVAFRPWAGEGVPMPDIGFLVPWGYHPILHPLGQALVIVASIALVLGYYTYLEANEGRSLGKRALGIRVMRVDGAPMTYREALLRNLVKLAPPLLVLDTVIMVLFLRQEKQRVSDKIADTVVVRA